MFWYIFALQCIDLWHKTATFSPNCVAKRYKLSSIFHRDTGYVERYGNLQENAMCVFWGRTNLKWQHHYIIFIT